MNRLTQDVDPVTGKTTTYTYDTRGNILSKTAAGQTVTYTYGDSTWKDLLTSYNGQTITYDTIGNPLSYRGMTFAWQQGRQLASATLANGTAISYRYNTDGIRIGKTVGNVTTEYVVDDSGTIHAMKQGEHTLIFMYDATGRREGFICYSSIYDDAAYYYLYNAQGDVIGLTDGDLNTVVQYAYDAWGNPTALTGTKASTIGTLNPFRYRGYVYDTETGLYYVSTRYYDAEVGRFINADAFDVLTATPNALTDKNLFAYCDNNPVVRADLDGEFWNVVIGAVVGGVTSFVSSVASVVMEKGWDFSGKDWVKIACSTALGATEGALIATCPGAATVISAAFSASDAAVSGLIDGDSEGEIVANSIVSGAFGAVTGAAGSDFKYGDKLINEAASSLGNAVKKGVHPAVKKTARKVVRKASKRVVKSYFSGQVESFAYAGLESFTSYYANEAIKRYR